MRLKGLYLAFLIGLFLNCINLIAQNSPAVVEKSTEKVLISGKVFFIHTVKKGETLFSIAKAYNTKVEEVIVNNPSLNNDIQVGQTIRIPDNPSKAASTQTPSSENGQVMHVVAAGQTIFGISRIYGVSVADIEAINPEVKYDSLQINQVIKIPLDKKEKQELTGKNYQIHKVAEKETLYSLSKKYGVSQEEIIKFNEPLLNNGLKVDTEIKIPIAQNQVQNTQENTSGSKKIETQVPNHKCNLETLKPKFDTINISLMLPLFAGGRKDVPTEKEDESNEVMQLKPSEEFDPVAVNFIEFYQGFMLAANELKRKGLYLNISVFDTEKSTDLISGIFDKPAVKKSNIIVGPVYKEQIKIALDKIQHNNSILVSPVAQHESLTQKNIKVYQVNPGLQLEYEKCIDYLLTDTSKNIVVIYKAEAGGNESSYTAFNNLLQSKIDATQARVKKLNVFNNDFSGLNVELDSLKDNIVFSPVQDEIFVTTMFSQLDAKLLLYRIQSVMLQDYVNYASIDLDYFYDLQAVYFSPFYTDFKNDITSNVLKKYRLIYGTEPVRNSKYGFNYGLLGYNLAYYFINAFSFYGLEISNHAECLKQLPLSSTMLFNQLDENGGFTNTQLQKIIFSKDYSLVVGN